MLCAGEKWQNVVIVRWAARLLIATVIVATSLPPISIKADDRRMILRGWNRKKKIERQPQPVPPRPYDSEREGLTEITSANTIEGDADIAQPDFTVTEPYAERDVTGVLSFRGGNRRAAPSVGLAPVGTDTIEKIWTYQCRSALIGRWGGGTGWTGQPCIIRWRESDRRNMTRMHEWARNKPGLVEVVQATLDGHVYFIDLETGRDTRPPIAINNPVKGTCALDPRGWPLLYVGQGIPNSGGLGFRIFDLTNHNLLKFINGRDRWAYRGWGAFDGAALVDRRSDRMLLGGENGLLYRINLNTNYDRAKGLVSIDPVIAKYRYRVKGNSKQGIENSVAAWKHYAWFADNGGSVQCVDLRTLEPVWAIRGTDDTDATVTVDLEGETPFIYTGCEVDHQGLTGYCVLRKLNGLTGEIVWEKPYPAKTVKGDRPVNGGLLASPVIGKKQMSNAVYFTISRYRTLSGGLMVALDKATGEEIWRWEMRHYAWSSPLDFYDVTGRCYLIQGDNSGEIFLIDGATGDHLDSVEVNQELEASPAMFDDIVVVGSRYSRIHAFRVSASIPTPPNVRWTAPDDYNWIGTEEPTGKAAARDAPVLPKY